MKSRRFRSVGRPDDSSRLASAARGRPPPRQHPGTGSSTAEPMVRRLTPGGRWIRTFSTAARKPRISEASRASRMPLAPGEGDVAKSRRSRLRCFPQNGTAPLVKVPAPSGPAAFPLQDATVGSRNRGAGQRDHQKHRFPARPSAVTSHLSPTRTCDRTKARAPEAPAVTHLPPRVDAQRKKGICEKVHTWG